MSVHTDTIRHASLKNHELFNFSELAVNVSRNSAEKCTASLNLSRIFPMPAKLFQKIWLRGLAILCCTLICQLVIVDLFKLVFVCLCFVLNLVSNSL